MKKVYILTENLFGELIAINVETGFEIPLNKNYGYDTIKEMLKDELYSL